jgi:hypothetical protein
VHVNKWWIRVGGEGISSAGYLTSRHLHGCSNGNAACTALACTCGAPTPQKRSIWPFTAGLAPMCFNQRASLAHILMRATKYSLCPFLPCTLGLVKVKLDKVWPNILLELWSLIISNTYNIKVFLWWFQWYLFYIINVYIFLIHIVKVNKVWL